MKRFISLFLCLITILSCFAACGSDSESVSVYYPVTSGASHMDPQIASTSTERIFVRNCFEGLVTTDGEGNIVGGAAESWSVSDDGLTYIFRLRTDTAWHVTRTSMKELGEILGEDFAPSVTAADFVFGLRRAVSPETGAPDASLLSCIKNAKSISEGKSSAGSLGVYAVDEHTLKIELDCPDSDLLYSLTKPVAMPCNEEFFNACKGRYGLSLEYMLCNGPFFLYSISEGVYVLLTKSDEYKGYTEVKPDNVYLYTVEDETAAAEKIKDGKYDAGILGAGVYSEVFGSKARKFTAQPRSDIMWAYCFNERDEYLAVPEIRKALAYSYDESIISSDSEYVEKIDRITTSYMVPSYDFSPSVYSYSEQKASALYSAGLAKSQLSTTALTVLTTEEYAPQVRQQIQKWQKALGSDVKIRTDTKENVMSAVASGDYQIAFCPLTYSSNRVYSVLESFTSTSPSNISGYTDAGYDAAFAEIRSIDSEGGRILAFKKLEQKLISEAVIIPVFTQNSYFVMGKGVSGIYAPNENEVSFIGAIIG